MESQEKKEFLINLSSIIKYIGQGLRPYEEGERVYKANHVLYCGISAETLSTIEVMALCIQTSAIHENPHEIKIVITENNLSCTCSCKAGTLGKCKHCVAVLIYLNRTKVCDIETTTCTDMKQQWGKVKSTAQNMYAIEPVELFCHLQKKRDSNKLIRYDYQKKTNFLNLLTKDLDENVELIKVRKGYRSAILTESNEEAIEKEVKDLAGKILSIEIYPPIHNSTVLYRVLANDDVFNQTYDALPFNVKSYYNKKVKIDFQQAVDICFRTRFQNNSLWLELRKIRITASNAYILFTYTSNKNPDWNQKIEKYLNSTFKGTAATRHGIIMEERAVKCYERCTDFSVTLMGLLVNPCIPWPGYSPDGIVPNAFILEIKSPQVGKKMSASNAVETLSYTYNDDEGNVCLKKKHMYYCQVQLGMFISSLHFCHFVIYSSFDDTCFIIEVPYDRDIVINNYIPVLQAIYFRYILTVLSESDEQTEKNS